MATLENGVYTLKQPLYIEWDYLGKKGSGIVTKYEVKQGQSGYILKDGGFMCINYITKKTHTA